jgi:glycosyltransferase involved in cell wall biosynthesis|tara:strand:+ start:724 stop:1392 length:669 start_codon:yes stop_codon:yes gene_type:complete
MNDLTLVIPAKNEPESLPFVLMELKKLNLNFLVVLEKNDFVTINSIEKFKSNIIYQVDKGYGDAILLGIKNVKTKYFSIFNADGSFDPYELKEMYNQIKAKSLDVIFASRYLKNASSEDDTIVTFLGNKVFSLMGKFFFNLPISDILYTFVIGDTQKILSLDLKQKDFTFCVELPIKAKRNYLKIADIHSNEKSRIGGIKKVNEIRDGFLILLHMVKLFLNR